MFLGGNMDEKFNLSALYDFGEKKVIPASDLVKSIGKLIYTKEDVEAVSDPLMKLFRKTFYEEQVRYDHFVSQLKEYFRDEYKWSPAKIKHQVGNLNKTLYKPYISYTKFRQYMGAAGLRIKRITCIVTKDDEYKTYEGE